jgi:hypothetical protein
MTVRDLLTALQTLPRDAELLAFEAGCEDYCEREVGHLSRPAAQAFAPVGQRLAEQRQVGACSAIITGGWDRGDGDTGHFGVTLDLAHPDQLLQSNRL